MKYSYPTWAELPDFITTNSQKQLRVTSTPGRCLQEGGMEVTSDRGVEGKLSELCK